MCIAYTYMCTNSPVKTRARKRHHANLIAIGYFVVLLALLEPVLVVGHGGLLGHGTIHEQLGQAHYPPVELTPYTSTVHYSADRNRSSWAITPVFKFTHCLFDTFVSSNSALPPGYLTVKNGDTLALGPKVEKNDWSALLAHYWLALVWVLFLVLLILLMPFIAVCYCCFCCCRRCKKGCPPCQAKEDSCRNTIYSMLLLLLILFMLIGAIIAFTSNRTLDRGLDDTRITLRRGTEDTCRFLKDVSNHIHHIFIYNYEELEAHLNDMLTNAHLHIFLDLADVSEANAIEQLDRIMDNMKEAKLLMRKVDKLEKDLRFYGTQLRDGVRGAKRDVNYACANLISHEKCQSFLRNSAMEFVDASPCLHLDKMPNTTVFVKSMRSIILATENVAIPKRALKRFQEIGAKIDTALQQIIPPLVRDVTKARDQFVTRSGQIRTLIDKVISDIHMRTLRSTQSFEDVYEKFGSGRSYVNGFACTLIVTAAIILIAALICACCGRLAIGATCLLIAIIFIFCIFSFCVLIGLLYFVLGMVTYQGACAPLRDQGGNAMFRELDAAINLRHFLPQMGEQSDKSQPALRMSTAIKACLANQSIFDLLLVNNLYDAEDLENIVVMSPKTEEEQKEEMFEDLSELVLLTEEEATQLDGTRAGDLGPYHSVLYIENMCRPVTPNLDTLSAGLRTVRDNIYYDPDWDYWNKYGRYSLTNEAFQFDTYNKEWTEKIRNIMERMKQNLIQIDELILYENRDYNNSIAVLLSAVQRSEQFIRANGKDFVNALGANLTAAVNEQVDQFLQDLVGRCNKDVGHCTPLAYIYYRGVDLICYRLVDPMNGFWVGMLLASLLLLPILIVAHKLMCLWKRMHAAAVPLVVVVPEGGCPTCTGAAYVPPPIMVCTGGQQIGQLSGGQLSGGQQKGPFCVCDRTDAGVARSVASVPQAGASAVAATTSKDTLNVRFHPKPPTKPKKE